MAIRWKNIDKHGIGSLAQPHHYVFLGDVPTAATRIYNLFIAPEPCTIDRVNLYVNNSASAHSGSFLHLEMRNNVAASNTLISTVTTTPSDASFEFHSNSAFGISPSSHNSFSRGTMLLLAISSISDATLSQVTAEVIWSPKENRTQEWSAV